jgi:hypothetical protein
MAPSRGFIPRRRGSGIVTEELEGETLLYVEETHRAFCLIAPAARVWRSIDGERDAEGVAATAEVEAPLVERTLREMEGVGLLDVGKCRCPRSICLAGGWSGRGWWRSR